VLGNKPVGTGAVVMAKAIVNKPVPPLANMSGVRDDLEEHLAFKYLDEWKELEPMDQNEEGSTAVASSK